MKTGKRTSARQAAAKSRISQIDSPAGSSPPFEQPTPAPATMPPSNWTTNPDRQDERRIVSRMIEHLHDDKDTDDNLEVFRFLCREWTTYSSTMHTRTTMEAVKRKLLETGVRYIHRATDGMWSYWTTYDDIMEFQPYQENSSDTDANQLDHAESMDDSVDVAVDRDTTTEKYLIQPSEEEDILPTEDSTMPYADPTATQQLRRMTMADHVSMPPMLHEHTSQPADDRDVQTDKSNQTRILNVETADAAKTADKGYSSNASLSSHMDSMIDDEDQDPFIPVPMRGRYKKSKYQFLQMPNSTSPIDLTESPDRKITRIMPKLASLETPPPSARFDTAEALLESAQKSTFSEILNDRINEMMTRVEIKEQSILEKMEAREESLRKMERKLATERGRHLHTLKEYDIHMTTRETNENRSLIRKRNASWDEPCNTWKMLKNKRNERSKHGRKSPCYNSRTGSTTTSACRKTARMNFARNSSKILKHVWTAMKNRRKEYKPDFVCACKTT